MRRLAPLLAAVAALAACQGNPPANDDDPAANFSLNAAVETLPDDAAAGPADPEADEAAIRTMLGRIYAPYAQAERPARDMQTFFAPDMAAAMRGEAARALAADPFLGARQATPFTPTIGAITVNGDSATASVTYTQQRPNPRRDRPPIPETRRIQFTFTRGTSDWGTGRGWKIGEIASPATPSLRRALGLRELRR